jgi:hypothetical protein
MPVFVMQVTASHNLIEMITLLLWNRADINADGGYYGNALSPAVFGGHII